MTKRQIDKLIEDSRPKASKPKSTKILCFDIENAPCEAYVWNTKMWNTSINPCQLKHDWYMLCWSAKWFHDCEVMSDCVTPNEARKRNDKRIIKSLKNLLDSADIVIAHNGTKFDIPMVNTRLVYYGLPPVSPYQLIDTLKVAKRELKNTFNSLNELGKHMNLGCKDDTDFQLWVDCMNGDKEQLERMSKYCDRDVILLEDVYTQLRPFAHSHPNINIYEETTDCCHKCGSSNIKSKGFYSTNTRRFETFYCKDCKGFSRQYRKILGSVAR